MRVGVVIGTYNEAENLAPLLDEVRRALSGFDYRVVVVDDRSPDGTGELADAAAAKDRRISVIHRPGKLGLGSAMTLGMRRALADGAEVVVTMDADLSHPPEALPRLLAAIKSGADVAVGSRYVAGGRISGWSLTRRLLSAGANALTRLMIGSRVRDNTGNYRAFRHSVFDRLDLTGIHSEGYTYFIEMLWALQRQGLRIAEVPIHFQDRRAGASKIPRVYMLQAFALLLRLSRRRIR